MMDKHAQRGASLLKISITFLGWLWGFFLAEKAMASPDNLILRGYLWPGPVLAVLVIVGPDEGGEAGPLHRWSIASGRIYLN